MLYLSKLQYILLMTFAVFFAEVYMSRNFRTYKKFAISHFFIYRIALNLLDHLIFC